MFSLFKNTHPATSVEHSLYCRFYGGRDKNLLVSGANILRVFRLIPDSDAKSSLKDPISKQPPKMKLECTATYTLFGNIMSMACISPPNSPRDIILLSFFDAKLSLVEYDPLSDSLKTLSLHHFEDEELKRGWTMPHHVPEIRVDPEGRCAVLLIYKYCLAVLPFCKDSEVGNTSASYLIKLTELEESVDNVIDVQFLHGYYEPTLLIIYEPVRTFAGRLAVRLDTCCMVAISLNTYQKVHPIIWSLSGLPFDCCQVVAVPKPIGGALLVTVNGLIYVNQSVPPYGVSVNSIADHSTNFPLKPLEGSRIALDCCHIAFLTPERLVISLKGGELYVLTFFTDSMNSVRKFHLEKAAASVLTTCVCVCDEYLFLGSRLGNSLLLAFSPKEDQTLLNRVTNEKKHELESAMEVDLNDIQDEDELDKFLYGDEDEATESIVTYQFEVCDSLLNIGPCGQAVLGEPAVGSGEFGEASSIDPDVELVTTAGYGKNGALCVLQRSVKPQIVTTFELPGVKSMWTVLASNKAGLADDECKDTYLLLTREDSTVVLQAGREINELDQSGFSSGTATVLAANVGNNRCIVQVCSDVVKLLDGSAALINEIKFEADFKAVSASVSDPYIVVLDQNGRLVLLTFKETKAEGPRLAVQYFNADFPVSCLNVYCDVSGLFTRALPNPESAAYCTQNSSEQIPNVVKKETDDEDDFLYGDSATANNETSSTQHSVSDRIPTQQRVLEYFREMKPTFWLCVASRQGDFTIYSLPELRATFSTSDVQLGRRTLADKMNAVPSAKLNAPAVREILLVGLGHLHRRPLLFIRLEDNEVLIYEAYPFFLGLSPQQLKLRFRKLNHSMLLRERRQGSRKVDSSISSKKYGPCTLKYFTNIAGYSGVFIGGAYPHWVLMTSRGELRTHPMGIDGPVVCFEEFDNVNCPQGFIYLNKKDELRICLLPTHLSYDAPWPVRKVPLRCTPHFLTYHVETKTYALVASVSEPTNRIYRFNGDDKELSVEERDDRFPYPCYEKFFLQLVSPGSWELVPSARLDMADWEHVTCLKTVSLAYEGHASGLRDYLAISSNFNYGEDIITRGKIAILDLIEVVPEPGQPLTKNKIKVLYEKEQKGPVSALCSVSGFLVAAVGQKIYLWQMKDDDLVGIAFMDTDIYIHQLLNIKNFIIAADIYKSISILRFQEEYRTLCVVTKDFDSMEAFAVEYFVDNTQLGFLVSDSEKNIVLFMYQPEARESYGGTRLIRKADFHIGQPVTTMFRIRCKLRDPTSDRRHPPIAEKRHITTFATLDGGIGHLLPLPEKTYRRLQMLHNVLLTFIPHIAGMNPKWYRSYNSRRRTMVKPAKGIVDGELVFAYLSLSHEERVEVARKIGTCVEEILDDLTEIDRYTAHY